MARKERIGLPRLETCQQTPEPQAASRLSSSSWLVMSLAVTMTASVTMSHDGHGLPTVRRPKTEADTQLKAAKTEALVLVSKKT